MQGAALVTPDPRPNPATPRVQLSAAPATTCLSFITWPFASVDAPTHRRGYEANLRVSYVASINAL
jgi:hypothetical protein